MTENGDPLENPIAERLNRTIKEEFSSDEYIWYPNIAEAKKNIDKIVKFYNETRPHSSIEMLTPSQAYHKNGALMKKWKNYYKSDKNKVEKMLNLI